MKETTLRDFIRIGGIVLAVGLVVPQIAIAAATKEIEKQLLIEKTKRELEPGLDHLTKRIIQIESQWYPKAVSPKKARGLMQITPIVLKEWNWHGNGRIHNKYDLFDPFISVNIGKWYLHERIGEHYLPNYGLDSHDENKAASYNAGPVFIGKEIGDAKENFHKLPKKTQNYLRKLWKLS